MPSAVYENPQREIERAYTTYLYLTSFSRRKKKDGENVVVELHFLSTTRENKETLVRFLDGGRGVAQSIGAAIIII